MVNLVIESGSPFEIHYNRHLDESADVERSTNESDGQLDKN